MARASTFTSYINAELPSDLDGTWRRYEQLATKTFSNIEKRAADASRAVAGLSGGRGAGGIGLSSGAAGGQARQIRQVDEVNRRLAKSTHEVSRGFDRQSKSMQRTARESSRAARGLSAVSTSLNIVQGPLGPLAGRVSALSHAISDLTGFRLGLAGIASSLFVLGSVGNQYASLEARLRGAFVEQGKVNDAMRDVETIARNARSALDPIAETYVKLAKAGEQYNISQRESARLTETIAKAATLSGGTRQSQEAGITQLGQAFASGTLSGDELKSIRENTFVLAQAIANGLGVAVGELKELGAAGELTAERIAEALNKSAFEIDARFASMPKTVSQGITELKNSFTIMVGSFDQAIGFSRSLAGFMVALAGAMKPLAAAAVGLGVAFASVKAAKLGQDIAASIGRYKEMQTQMRTLAQTRKADAQAQVGFTQRAVQGLNQQQAEIRELIALREREAQLAQNNLRRTRNDPMANAAGVKRALQEQVAAQQALNAARRNGAATADSLAAAERRLEVAQTRLNRATQVAARRSSVLRGAMSSLIGVINPLGIAIGIATTALITMATQSDAAKDTLEEFGDEAVSAAKKAIGLAESNHALAESFYEVARAQGVERTRKAKDAQAEVAEQFIDRLEQLGVGARSQANKSRIGYWIEEIRNGTADMAKFRVELERLQKIDPAAFKGGGGELLTLPEWLQANPSMENIRSSGAAFTLRQEAVRQALEDEKEIERMIEESRSNVRKPTIGGSVSVSGLRTQAQADALDEGTSAIKAAGIRRKEALRQLNEDFEVQGGKIPGARAEEYRARAAEIERAYNAEVEGVRAAAKARTAGARESAAAAQQEIRDNRELAKSRLQAGLLELERNKPNLTTEEYYQARIKLLQTYDAESEAADETAENVSKAVGQMIRDTREMQKAATGLAERRRDILGGWDDAPKALTRARDQIDDLNRAVGKFIEIAPGQFELYTSEQAASDANNIMQGVVRPLTLAAEQARRFSEVSQLRLDGFDLEADALERALDLQDDIGRLSREQFENIVAQTEEQQRINNLLAQRDRLMQPILDSVSRTRDAFEDMLVDLPDEGGKAITGFFKSVQMQMRQIYARQITEALFGGADEKMRELLGTQQGGVDAAYEYLANHAKATGTEFERVASTGELAATALERVAGAADQLTNSLPGGVGGTAENTIADIANSGGVDIAAAARGIFNRGSTPSGAPYVDENGVIVLPGPARTAPSQSGGSSSGNRKGSSGLRALGDTFGDELNKVFGTTFFRGMGDAFAGAGTGMMASGVAGMLGLKQSNTGAAIGGAIGSMIPIPGGSIIGGLIGGTIGGLFKKTRRSSANLTGPGDYTISGNGKSSHRDAAGGLADQVLDQLDAIAEAVGGTVGAFRTSIGVSGDSYHVDTTGRGRLRKSQGGHDFDQDAQAAIAFAIADAVADGAIRGISAASQRILRSGQDLQKAIEKAVAIESIPRRLRAIKDPVGFAIDELNREFVKLIDYLKEGGATAEQFSEAQELYDLQRAEAIEQATQNAVGAIEQFMEDMISSGSSPLNKRTVYDNASETLGDLAERINAGEVVDQNALTAAAANFQDASRNLFGSSQDFFADFDMLYDLLGRARDNALVGGVDENGSPTVAPSPFEQDAGVRALIDQYRGVETAIGDQTGALSDLLREIRDSINAGGGVGGGGIGNLPGFQPNVGGGRSVGYTGREINVY